MRRGRTAGPGVPVLLAWAVVAAVLGTAGAAAGSGHEPDEQVRRGGAIYQATCAACHGTDAQGGTGGGRHRAPRLVDVDLAYVDLTIRTGRMPIAAPEVGVVTDQLDDDEREALLAFMADRFGLEGEVPVVGPGDPTHGQQLYVRHCAACHGAFATGGISGGGVIAPGISAADPVVLATAIRVGPFEMPAFSGEVLDDRQVDDLVAYLAAAEDEERTLGGLREVGHVNAAVAAMLLLATTLAVLRVSSGRRREGDAHEPAGGGRWT